MAKFRIQGPNGQAFEITAPDGTTQEQVQALVMQQIGGGQQQASQPARGTPEYEAERQRIIAEGDAQRARIAQQHGAKPRGGIWMGITDPFEGASQLIEHGAAAAANAVAPESRLAQWLTDNSRVNDVRRNLDETRYEAARGPDAGLDVGRIAGNVLNPANVAGGRALVGANTVRQLAGRGALAGAGGAALQPVIGEQDQDNFAASKGTQAAAGGVGGAVLTPALGAATRGLATAVQAVGRRFVGADDAVIQQRAGQLVDDWMRTQTDVDLSAIPAGMRARVQAQVAEALKTGKQVDPAALARAADFESLGIQPTVGQVTRAPTQFARERNLRGVEGAGEPLAQRFADQDNALLRALSGRAGTQTTDRADDAGNALMTALRAADEPAEAAVRAGYRAARESSGKAADVPMTGLAQDAQRIVENYGDRVPSAVVSKLKAFGILDNDGTQRRIFDFEAADGLLKQINSLVGSDKATNSALGELRAAVKRAITEQPAGVADPYAGARSLAASRFKLLDETPGLRAALEGDTPDNFVRKFLIGGDSRSVNNLMKVLSGNEEALTVARGQVAAYLRDKAFGANAAGDKGFSQEAYNRALKSIGQNKLMAIFGQQGADELAAIGRVGAYIHSQPSGAAVNNSNTASALMNLLGIVGKFPGVNLARDSFRTYGNERFAGQALSGQVPSAAAGLSPEAQSALLRYIVGPGAVTGGAALGAAVN